MLAIVAVVAATATPAAARKHPPIPKPPEWPEAVKPLVRFVEENRGFEFDVPVEVDLLSEEAFARRLDQSFFGGFGLGGFVAQLAALGLASADDRVRDLATDQLPLGYTDPFAGIVIRGPDPHDPLTRLVLVHELAHALVFQEYKQLAFSSAVGTFAYRALVEGDATRVEVDYLDSLPERRQSRINEALSNEPAVDAPLLLDIIGGAPYSLGAGFIRVIDELGERNPAFRKPPKSDVDIIDPLREVDGDAAPLRLERLPQLAPGEQRRGPAGELGQLLVFMTLASRLDAGTSLEAAVGWAGDRTMSFRRAGQDCMHLAVRGVTTADTDRLAFAFAAWASLRPPGDAVVVRREGDVLVTACEREGASTVVPDLAERVSLMLGGSLYWSAEALAAGYAPAVARCVGQGMAVDPEVLAAERGALAAGRRASELADDDARAAKSRLEEIAASCRASEE